MFFHSTFFRARQRVALFLSLFFLIALTGTAQIQRKFFGFMLGETTKEQVITKLNSEKKLYIDHGENIYVAKPRFAGYDWDVAILYFYNSILYQVFLGYKDRATANMSNSMFNSLSENLSSKYSNYKKDISTDSSLFYADGETICVIIKENDTVDLSYCDSDMYYKKADSEKDEL